MQRMIDQPIVVSYSNNFTINQANSSKGLSQQKKTALPQEFDTNAKLRNSKVFKSLVFALGHNEKGEKQVLIRVQNMQDSFDGTGDALQFNVDQYARTLYKQANPGHPEAEADQMKLEIEETNLSGVSNYEKIQ